MKRFSKFLVLSMSALLISSCGVREARVGKKSVNELRGTEVGSPGTELEFAL